MTLSTERQTNNEADELRTDELRKELVSVLRDGIMSGKIRLRKKVDASSEDLDVFVRDKAILLEGLDVLTLDIDINFNDKRKLGTALYFYTNYTMLTSDGVVDTFLPLGGSYDFRLSEQQIKLLESYHAVDICEMSSYGLHVGSIRDLEVSLAEEDTYMLNVSYKVEWDGEVRIVV